MIEISRLRELCTLMDIMVEKLDEDHYFCNYLCEQLRKMNLRRHLL